MHCHLAVCWAFVSSYFVFVFDSSRVPTNLPVSNDRLVNAANTTTRAYVTINRPTGGGNGDAEHQRTAAGTHGGRYGCEGDVVAMKGTLLQWWGRCGSEVDTLAGKGTLWQWLGTLWHCWGYYSSEGDVMAVMRTLWQFLYRGGIMCVKLDRYDEEGEIVDWNWRGRTLHMGTL